MYISNVLALVILAFCIRHIRKQTPLQNIVLAWLYVIDTVANVAFTAVFAVSWYLAAGVAAGPAETKGADEQPDTSDWMAPHETAASMVLIIAFSLARIYCSLVIMAHTRLALQRHMERQNADHPFAAGSPAGAGWRGKMGRALVAVGKGYWLGCGEEDEEWTRTVKSKFQSAEPTAETEEAPGT